jgi:uncharacterized protein (UPF0276 family)
VGVGLRPVHYGHILENRPAVPWFEAVSENYMGGRGGSGGRPREILERVRTDYPVVLHGVSLNVGSTDPLREDYLDRLKTLADEVDPPWVSDHLCWTGVDGENTHDLLPLPYTEEALEHVAARVRRVQDRLDRPFLLENVSSYVAFRHSEMTEWEFLSEVARRADCGILLDVNNIHVSAVNHGFDPRRYVDAVPAGRVRQMHLAGPSAAGGGFLIDTHDHPVPEPVWDLYAAAVRRFGPVPTLIEWDGDIPDFAVLEAQAARARKIMDECSPHREPAPAR